jgi:hypothetical protein
MLGMSHLLALMAVDEASCLEALSTGATSIHFDSSTLLSALKVFSSLKFSVFK